MFTAYKVTEIFFKADEFNKVYWRMVEKYGYEYPGREQEEIYNEYFESEISMVALKI